MIHAKLSPTPCTCINCGSSSYDSQGKKRIIKNGHQIVTGRFEQYNHIPTIMKLKKQRVTCKNCSTHWTTQSYFVRLKQFKSNLKSLIYLKRNSLFFFAKLTNVSITTVLPKVVMVDEFRSHARTEDKMSFICADGETGQLIDIIPSRKLSTLTTYFKQFSTK